MANTLPAPPTSKSASSRRERSGGSSETMPGLNEHYHREGLREGSPAPLSYWPGITRAITSPNPITSAWDAQLKPKVLGVLSEYGIHYRSLVVLKRRDMFWPSGRPDETLIIDVPAQYYRNDNWYLATSELRTFFSSVGFADLIVEIVDTKSFMRSTWAIEPSDSVIQEWPHIQNLLTEQLNGDEATCLQSINVFKRGFSNDKSKSKVTVILTASELYGLRKIEDRIRERLDINGYSHIALEMVRDRVIRLAAPSIRNLEYYQLQQDPDAITLGLSVGVRDADESGTLGATIGLQGIDGQVISLGLTCYHVVRPGLTELQRQDADSHGVAATADYPANVVLVHPSSTNHEQYLKVLGKSINDAKSDSQSYEVALAEALQKVKTGIRSPGFEKKWQKMVDDQKLGVKALERNSLMAKEFHSRSAEIGRLFAASGFTRRSAQNHRLDWALVRLTQSAAPGSINTPSGEQGHPPSTTPLRPPIAGSPLGRTVFKKGRSTGYTAGVISGIKSMIYLDGEEPSKVVPSSEYVIIHEDGTGEVFGTKGDSGSVIVDSVGRFQGLLFAGAISSNWVYMTPYEALVTDIEQATGGRFIL